MPTLTVCLVVSRLPTATFPEPSRTITVEPIKNPAAPPQPRKAPEVPERKPHEPVREPAPAH